MQELWFLCSVCRLMLIDIYIKFLEDILNTFQVTERTRFCDRQSFTWKELKYKCKSYGSCTQHVV